VPLVSGTTTGIISLYCLNRLRLRHEEEYCGLNSRRLTDYFGMKHVCANETTFHQKKMSNEGQLHHRELIAKTSCRNNPVN
jgi:hypothetical protein